MRLLRNYHTYPQSYSRAHSPALIKCGARVFTHQSTGVGIISISAYYRLISSRLTRTTRTPSLTGMISTRSPFASVRSIAAISDCSNLTGLSIDIIPQNADLSIAISGKVPVLPTLCIPPCGLLLLGADKDGLSCGTCRVQHQFVIAMAFYPLLLMVYYPISSAYIIILSDAKHSWKDYCFHNAHPLRSTVSAVC